MTVSLNALLSVAVTELQSAGVEDPVRDARILASYAAGVPMARLSLILDQPVSQLVADKFDRAIAQRVARVPVAHITGVRAFYKHEFIVTPDVLDPRADTECLIEAALEQPFKHVLDLGTGSGCILLSLLAERSQASGVGTDISPEALDVALKNAEALRLHSRCMFLCADWFEGVEGRYDLIVSNPPYVSLTEMEHVSREVRHEPRGALTDEADGLSMYRKIVPQARDFLDPQGRLIVEIGWQQAKAVSQMFLEAGFGNVSVKQDLAGRDRAVIGKWNG